MLKRIIIICALLFIAITQFGCIGFIVNSPAECENETPRPDIYKFMQVKEATPLTPPFWRRDPRTSFTKTDFLNDWGKPDEIITISGKGETWVYKKNLWCGWIPVLIIPVPLILPVCNGFYRLDFQDDVATRLHTRHIVSNGSLLILFYPVSMITGGAGVEPACREPIYPNNGVDPDATDPKSLNSY